MIDGFSTALLVAALVLAAAAFGLALAGRPPARPLLLGLVLLQVAVLVQGVIALLRLGDWDGSVGEFLGYLVVSALLLPGGMVLSVEERSRWGSAVLGAVCFTLAVVVLRLQQVWDAGV